MVEAEPSATVSSDNRDTLGKGRFRSAGRRVPHHLTTTKQRLSETMSQENMLSMFNPFECKSFDETDCYHRLLDLGAVRRQGQSRWVEASTTCKGELVTNVFSAVVTGGGSGIGSMIASAYVQNGAKVYIASRKEQQLKEASPIWFPLPNTR